MLDWHVLRLNGVHPSVSRTVSNAFQNEIFLKRIVFLDLIGIVGFVWFVLVQYHLTRKKYIKCIGTTRTKGLMKNIYIRYVTE